MKYLFASALVFQTLFCLAQQKPVSQNAKNFKVESTRDAQYVGGEQQLYIDIHQKLKYTEEARNGKVDTRIMVSLVVGTDSTAGNIKIMNDPGYSIGDSVKVFLQKSRFVPALMNGTPVKTQLMLNLPIRAH
jgi:hypothetical protein